MEFDVTDPGAVGVTVERSQIIFEKPGTYNVQFSAQIDIEVQANDFINIWLADSRGEPIPWTNTRMDVAHTVKEASSVAAWNFFVTTTGENESVQLMWQSPNPNMRLYAEGGSGFIPEIPSVILTVNQVQ
jgi:hypothetical protein